MLSIFVLPIDDFATAIQPMVKELAAVWEVKNESLLALGSWLLGVKVISYARVDWSSPVYVRDSRFTTHLPRWRKHIKDDRIIDVVAATVVLSIRKP